MWGRSGGELAAIGDRQETIAKKSSSRLGEKIDEIIRNVNKLVTRKEIWHHNI